MKQNSIRFTKPILQIKFLVQRSNSGNGFVAIDEVQFRTFEDCVFTPPEAKPVSTTQAPTTSLSSTIEPTEPPSCKLKKHLNYTFSMFL